MMAYTYTIPIMSDRVIFLAVSMKIPHFNPAGERIEENVTPTKLSSSE